MTAYRALFQKTDTRPNDVLFVHGATGGVGLAAVQLARWRGVKHIIATAGALPACPS